MVGVIVATGGIEAVLALHSLGHVIYLIAIYHLLWVKLTHTGYWVGSIHALNGACLVLARVFPGNSLVPVEVWGNRVTLLVFLNLESLVAAVSRVGKALE